MGFACLTEGPCSKISDFPVWERYLLLKLSNCQNILYYWIKSGMPHPSPIMGALLLVVELILHNEKRILSVAVKKLFHPDKVSYEAGNRRTYYLYPARCTAKMLERCHSIHIIEGRLWWYVKHWLSALGTVMHEFLSGTLVFSPNAGFNLMHFVHVSGDFPPTSGKTGSVLVLTAYANQCDLLYALLSNVILHLISCIVFN